MSKEFDKRIEAQVEHMSAAQSEVKKAMVTRIGAENGEKYFKIINNVAAPTSLVRALVFQQGLPEEAKACIYKMTYMMLYAATVQASILLKKDPVELYEQVANDVLMVVEQQFTTIKMEEGDGEDEDDEPLN